MTGTTLVPQLITAGVMAADLDEPLHRVLYVLATRQQIRPAARAGTLRLYDREAVAMVRRELAEIDSNRGLRVKGRRWSGEHLANRHNGVGGDNGR